MTLPVKRWFPAGLRDAPGAMCFVIERERERGLSFPAEKRARFASGYRVSGEYTGCTA